MSLDKYTTQTQELDDALNTITESVSEADRLRKELDSKSKAWAKEKTQLTDLVNDLKSRANGIDLLPTPKKTKKQIEYTIQYQGKDIKITNVHKETPLLLTALQAGENVMLVGPTGSFKTTAARQCSEILNRNFDFIALGPTMTESKIFGYMNAQGDYVETAFRRIYEKGGVFLFDEFDAGNPNVLVSINAAIENGYASFPDKLIKQHPDAVFICSANTWGRGADRLYVGRNQLDAATLERFVTIEWNYDEDLEMVISTNKKWCKYVQTVRKTIDKLGLRHPVSPRASFKGSKLLDLGLPQNKVEDMVLWKDLPQDKIAKVRGKLPKAYQPKED